MARPLTALLCSCCLALTLAGCRGDSYVTSAGNSPAPAASTPGSTTPTPTPAPPTPGTPSSASAAPAATAAPAIGVKGDQLTIDGKPAFLTLVSYFDALDANDEVLKEDFAYFKQHGIAGVRVFPNWWDCSGLNACRTPSPRTLMDATGALRAAPRERLERVLALAAEHRLIVDLSFARETVRDGDRRLGGAEYAEGLVTVTRLLAGRAPHVLFDLQNEIEINGIGVDPRDTAAAVEQLRARIREADPTRLVTASSGSRDLIARFAGAVDLLTYHDPRHADWWSRTAGEVAALRAIAAKPVYFQEPIAYQIFEARPGRDDTEVAHFVEARRAARQAGAAAWLFHTRKGFRLDDRSFVAQQEPGDRAFLTALAAER